MTTFGQYIKKRRKELNLRQEDFGDFHQTYISKIERELNRPTQRETTNELAKILQLPPELYDWFWLYSILNKDPMECMPVTPINSQPPNFVNETNENYMTTLNEIHVGATTEDVRRILGDPDDNLRFRNKEKWIYERKAIHVIFMDDKVTDITFK